MTAATRSMLAGVLLGAVFLVVAGWAVDWSELRTVLHRTDPFYAALIVPATVLYLLTKAARWGVLIRPIHTARTRQLFGSVCAGNAGNYLIPHFGELLRVMIAGDQLRAPRSALLGSIAVERLFDFAALTFLAAAVLIPAERVAAETAGAIWFIALAAAVLFVAIAAFMLWTEPLVQAIDTMARVLPARARTLVVRILRNGLPGLAMMRSPGLVVPVVVFSVLQWLLIALSMALSLKAVGIAVSAEAVAAVVLLNVVGLVLPAAPGHVGTIQLSFAVGLQGFGVPWETAIAASIVYNTLVVMVVMALGLPMISRAGLRVGEVLRRRAAD